MPNPGKSLQELQQTGTFKKHSGRYRGQVAAVEGFVPLGDPPAHFDEREAAAWDEIRRRAAPGTLADGDFLLVELASRLLVKSRHDWANFSPTDSRVLQSLANDLGMSPIKRGKVSAKLPKAKSPLSELGTLLSAPNATYKRFMDLAEDA